MPPTEIADCAVGGGDGFCIVANSEAAFEEDGPHRASQAHNVGDVCAACGGVCQRVCKHDPVLENDAGNVMEVCRVESLVLEEPVFADVVRERRIERLASAEGAILDVRDEVPIGGVDHVE